MDIDIDLFMRMLSIDSTSSKERGFADFLEKEFGSGKCTVSRFEVGDGTVNLLLSWGHPGIVFCSHLDTVPPYIPPVIMAGDDAASGVSGETGSISCRTDGQTADTVMLHGLDVKGPAVDDLARKLVIKGRAKGQIFSMYCACRELEKRGYDGFGLLLLAGEETGSFGAKSFRDAHPGGRYVIVGEPTDGKMVSASKGTKSFRITIKGKRVSASKGTKSFRITIKGKSFHSGYPQYGESAVEKFVDFMNRLRATEFPEDPLLWKTTWNVGKLSSDNPQNILSPQVSFRLYFRTTFMSDEAVCRTLDSWKADDVLVESFGGDTPMHYLTLKGFETATVSFGSDAPQLSNFSEKILCGPGSILVAHTPDEYIRLSDIRTAADNYVRMFELLRERK